MADILDDYREWKSRREERIGTHSDRCHLWRGHEACMIHRLAAELESTTRHMELTEAAWLRETSDNSPVAVRLTEEEREAVEQAIYAASGMGQAEPWTIRTLRGLLKRHCPTPENQPQQDNAHQTHSTTVECRVRHEWIPVSERLPEDGEQVLAYFQTNEVGEAVYIKQVNGFEDDRGGCWDASHWMPLPEPPEVKQ